MARELDQPEDVSALMEALWGAPREGPAGPDHRPGTPPATEHRSDVPEGVPAPDNADIGTDLSRRMELLRSDVIEAQAEFEARINDRMDFLEGALAAGLGSGAAGRSRARRSREPRGRDETDVATLRETVDALSEASVGRAEFVALRSELREALSRQMSAAHVELQRSVALLDAAIADARAQLGVRLDELAGLVSAEAAQAAERASAQANGVATNLQGDVQALRQQTEQIDAVVAALQAQFPPR